MESESSNPPIGQVRGNSIWDGQKWVSPSEVSYQWSLSELRKMLRPDPPELMLMPMSKTAPLPLDRLGGPDVLGLFPGSMVEFCHAVRYRQIDDSGRVVRMSPLMADCPEGMWIVGRLLAFNWQAGVLVGSATAIDRWLAMRE